MHLAMIQDDDSVYFRMLSIYEKRLNENELLFQRLMTNADKSEVLSLRLIEDATKTLKNTEQSIEQASLVIDNSLKSMEQADQLIKQENRKSKARQMLFGLGGFGIGIITGVLLMK
jgi:hypothetical protein